MLRFVRIFERNDFDLCLRHHIFFLFDWSFCIFYKWMFILLEIKKNAYKIFKLNIFEIVNKYFWSLWIPSYFLHIFYMKQSNKSRNSDVNLRKNSLTENLNKTSFGRIFQFRPFRRETGSMTLKPQYFTSSTLHWTNTVNTKKKSNQRKNSDSFLFGILRLFQFGWYFGRSVAMSGEENGSLSPD